MSVNDGLGLGIWILYFWFEPIAEIIRVTSTLPASGGLTANLPAGHPYRAEPP